ncbi:MAG TPA: response regulator [Candidatus Binatia bacterium]
MESKDESSRARGHTLPTPLVLLIEDEDSVREAIAAVLDTEGYRVRTARHGREALEMLRGGLRPCMIILDLMMPVMDGWQFRAEQLRDPELLKIPTVVYSAVGNIDEAIEHLNVAGGFEKGDFTEMLHFVAQFCPRR